MRELRVQHKGNPYRVLIAAMGGHLKLVAQFPDEEIVINQFEQQPI